MTDPCDVWPYRWPDYSTRMHPGHPPHPVTMEGFGKADIVPAHVELFAFAREVRTDLGHWPSYLDWTLESGPDDAPCVVEIKVPYRISGGGSDYFAGGCWNPGDPLEIEMGTAWFLNDHGTRCEVNLLDPESERVELHIAENPDEPDYGDCYD